jgi:hypothetical protein
MTYVLPVRRHGQHRGDPAQSNRLRLPTLAWQGQRSNSQAAAEIGIPLGQYEEWVGSHQRILSDASQQRVLSHPEIMARYRELDRRGLL